MKLNSDIPSFKALVRKSYFTKNPKANITVSKLEMRIEDAKKVIIMDADLSDRCLGYYKRVLSDENLDYQLIINPIICFFDPPVFN